MKKLTKLELWNRELDLMEQWYFCMENLEKMVSSCEEKIANIEQKLNMQS